MPTTQVVAHRGASCDAPENTLAAFALAVAQGADMIELDVRASADGVPVVIHDGHIDHGGVRHFVDSLSLRDLRALAPGVPTLDATLAWVVGQQVALNIELKVGGMEAATTALVTTYELAERVLFSSFLTAVLLGLRAVAPQVPRGLLTDTEVGPGENTLRDGSPLPLMAQVGAAAWHPVAAQVTEASIAAVHATGGRVNVWTVDDLTTMRRLLRWGVDGIITNRPALLRKLLLDIV